MDTPKLLIVLFAMLITSVFLMDVTVATIEKAELQEKTEMLLVNSIRDSIHLGDLRMGKVTIMEDEFEENMESQNMTNFQILSTSPPLVAVEAYSQKENASKKWMNHETTSMVAKVVSIADLRKEKEE